MLESPKAAAHPKWISETKRTAARSNLFAACPLPVRGLRGARRGDVATAQGSGRQRHEARCRGGSLSSLVWPGSQAD